MRLVFSPHKCFSSFQQLDAIVQSQCTCIVLIANADFDVRLPRKNPPSDMFDSQDMLMGQM